MSRTLPTRFEALAAQLADHVAPLLAEKVAELVADRWGELPPLLTVAEAARYLAIDEETVRRLARRGEIAHVRLGTGPKAPLRFDAKLIVEGFSPANTTEDDAMRRDVTTTPVHASRSVRMAAE